MYLQTFTFQSASSEDDRRHIRHQSQPYCIIGDTLYRINVDSILHRCLTLDEVERVLNDCILAHVVVIGLAMPLLKISFTLAISSPPSLRIAFLLSANATSARFMSEK